MSLFRYEKIIDKWLFGDVTLKDLNMFAATELHFNSELNNAKILLSLVKDKNSHQKDIDKYFLKTIVEMGHDIPSISRIDYIRNQFSEDANQLISSTTDAELDFIAHLDRGQDVHQHINALKTVIYEQTGLINDKQYWYPYEVIELGSFQASEKNLKAFAICNCVIAKNILWNTDRNREISWTFEDADRMKEFLKLPNELNGLVMSSLILAFRYQKAEELNPHYFPE